MDMVLKAAQRAMKKRGYLVAGFRYPKEYKPKAGMELGEWANRYLPYPWIMRLTEKTTRKDWDDQFAVVFPKKKYVAGSIETAQYWRATLERKEAVK